MILVVDANVLVRMVVGRRAAADGLDAVRRGVELMTTVAQLDEAAGVLGGVFHLGPDKILSEVLEVVDMMAVIDEESYVASREEAAGRLHRKAEGDWPVLAAALSMSGGIWSDDRDFFGTGVPVWSSPNIERANAA